MPDKPQAIMLDANSPSFVTPDGAADAVSKAFPQQDGEEQAAVVIKRPDGSYGYSTVAPQASHDHFEMRALLPKGHSIAAIVHSHPGMDDLGQVFSPDDVAMAGKLNVPSFIRFNKDSSIRRYTPGQTSTQMMQHTGDKFGMKVSYGDPIAQEPAAPDPQIASNVTQRDDSVTQH